MRNNQTESDSQTDCFLMKVTTVLNNQHVRLTHQSFGGLSTENVLCYTSTVFILLCGRLQFHRPVIVRLE